MFGLPNFNLDEMTQMVADFKVRHERMVSATERVERKLDAIIKHMGIDIPADNQVIEHDDSN